MSVGIFLALVERPFTIQRRQTGGTPMTWTRRNFHLSLPTLAVCIFLIAASGLRGDEPKAKVYVILWFDTEDYILPASDDAALRVADFLTAEKVRGTFKVVGEKARTLERRSRKDVIEALRKHRSAITPIGTARSLALRCIYPTWAGM